MTYKELYERACRMLDNNEITIGEWEQMIAPLDNEIEPKVVKLMLMVGGDLFVGEKVEHSVCCSECRYRKYHFLECGSFRREDCPLVEVN